MAKAFGIREVPALIPIHERQTVLDVPERIAADVLILDLPLPPSVNRTSGLRLGNEHPRVKAWRRSADTHLLFTKQSRLLRLIDGTVAIDIAWDMQVLGDIDNRLKHLLDYLQRLQVVSNDSKVRRLCVDYGTAPAGCRVRVRQWDWQS